MLPELEILFADTEGGAALCSRLIEDVQSALPEVELRPARTQIGLFHGCGFAWVWPARRKSERRQGCIGLSIGLPARVESERFHSAVEPYPGRWTHHMLLSSEREIDAELIAWLREAWHFAAFRSRK